jgi:hypothetical protein
MRFLLQPDKEGFVLKKDGEAWQTKFPSLREAIKHAESQPGSTGAKLVVLNEAGKPKLEIELGS